MRPPDLPEPHARIYAVVRAIPRGRVMTYGAVASAAGLPRRARLVGQLLRRLPEASTVPWHRVINAHGRISRRGEGGAEREQRLRLELEGVRFGGNGAVALDDWGHRP